MSIKYFVKAAVGEYEQNGTMKKRYQTIGIVLETKSGLMLKLESIPLHQLKEGALFAYLNEPEDEQKPRAAAPADDNDVPF